MSHGEKHTLSSKRREALGSCWNSNWPCVLRALGDEREVVCLQDPMVLRRSHRLREKPLVHKAFFSQLSLLQTYEVRWREAKSQCLCKLCLSTSIASISLWDSRGGGRTSSWMEWELPSGNDSMKAGKYREDLGRNIWMLDVWLWGGTTGINWEARLQV